MPPYIPEGIIDEVILRFPVKSLVRFRCVCKFWFNLITNPTFVKKKLNFSRQHDKFNLILSDKVYRLFSLDSYNQLFNILHTLGFPVNMIVPCDGLIFINTTNAKKNRKFINTTPGQVCGDIILNPSTNQHKLIPSPSIPPVPEEFEFLDMSNPTLYGFGYDHKIDDYKLVRIEKFPLSNICMVQVYRLRSNSWKTFQPISPYNLNNDVLSVDEPGVFVNGALHWIFPQSNYIFTFNISDERFLKLPLPDNWSKENNKQSYLYGVGESLCLVVFGYDNCEYYVDVWVMKEYGVIESWTKLSTILPPTGKFLVEMPLESFTKGDILFKVGLPNGDCGLISYNIDHQRAKILNNMEVPSPFKIIGTYVESLVSPEPYIVTRDTMVKNKYEKINLKTE